METNIQNKTIRLETANLPQARKYGLEVTGIFLMELNRDDRIDGPFHYGLELEYLAMGQSGPHTIYLPVSHPIKIRDGFDALFLVRYARNKGKLEKL